MLVPTFQVVRVALLLAAMVVILSLQRQYWKDFFLPWGYPIQNVPKIHFLAGGIDDTNDLLHPKHGKTKRIVERRRHDGGPLLLIGPETVVVDPYNNDNGVLYVLTEEGKLVRLSNLRDEDDGVTITADTHVVKTMGPGRPLGGQFTRTTTTTSTNQHDALDSTNETTAQQATRTTLYAADCLLGLTRVMDIHDPNSMVELVANRVSLPADSSTSSDSSFSVSTALTIGFADDVAIGPRTGNVYFTDATDIVPQRLLPPIRNRWDAMYSSKLHLSRGFAAFPTGTATATATTPSGVDGGAAVGGGRLLEYNPTTDTTRVLATGISFANGLAVSDANERSLIVAETMGPRILQYHLVGDKAGTVQVLLDTHELPGYPDGVGCSTTTPYCYAVFPSTIVPIHKVLNSLSHPWDWLLRTLILTLPRTWAPKVQPYGGILEFDPYNRTHRRLLQDPTGSEIRMLTGVTEYNHKLYLGSLENDFIVVYDLN